MFIAILADKLPPKQRDKARLIGLSLALVMRPAAVGHLSDGDADETTDYHRRFLLFRARSHHAARRIFLLFKATTELHERLENRQHDAGHGKGYASFWVVVLQIVVLDAVFSWTP